MRSRGLPTTVSALLKLDAVGSGGSGTWTAVRARFGGEWLFVGSEAECACLTVWCGAVGSLRGLGLDLAETRHDGDVTRASVDVGGHKGLLGSAMGLEMESLSIVELERLKLDLPLLFTESVNLVKEKAREGLFLGVLEVLPRGGVLSPMGTRSSTSLFERLSVLIVSSPSIFAPVVAVWSRALVVLHSRNEEPTHDWYYVLIGVAWGSGESKSLCTCVAVCRADVGCHARLRGAEGGNGVSTQPVKAC